MAEVISEKTCETPCILNPVLDCMSDCRINDLSVKVFKMTMERSGSNPQEHRRILILESGFEGSGRINQEIEWLLQGHGLAAGCPYYLPIIRIGDN